MPTGIFHSALGSLQLCGLLLLWGSASAQTSPQYARADSVAESLYGAPMEDLYGLATQLTEGLPTEEEKFRAIYTWIVQNIKNDSQLYNRTMNARKRYAETPARLATWTRRMQPKIWDRLLTKKKTLCSGYAYLLSHLAEQAGITAIPVAGYMRNSRANVGGEGFLNHHWNAVKLDGTWYLCDPTWSSGLYRLWGKKGWEDPYFLLDPALFVLTHYPVDTTWLLLESPPGLDAFLQAPLVYPAAQQARLLPEGPSSFRLTEETGNTIKFRFRQEADEALTQLKLLWVADTGKDHEIWVPVQFAEDGTTYVEYTFHWPGDYTVHLRKDHHFLLTYQIAVK
ncbi:MAG: transglutaminase domain-containing protein [Bacteroidota bacterium]